MLKFRTMTQMVTSVRYTDVPLEGKMISAAAWKVAGQVAENQEGQRGLLVRSSVPKPSSSPGGTGIACW